MTFDELVSSLCAKLETEDADLIKSICESQGRDQGTLNGHFVSQLQVCILSLLGGFQDPDKVEAYNQLADSEGLSPLGEDDVNIDTWIHEAFLDPVIDRLLETDSPNRAPEDIAA